MNNQLKRVHYKVNDFKNYALDALFNISKLNYDLDR